VGFAPAGIDRYPAWTMTAADQPRPLVALIAHPRPGAGAFARTLVERRVAACVQQIEVRSVYRWEGEVEDEREILLLVKTTDRCLVELEELLETAHPYAVPELVVLEPAHVKASYLDWLLAETGPLRSEG
jgi:periplasmic divalent cation tolerance protein